MLDRPVDCSIESPAMLAAILLAQANPTATPAGQQLTGSDKVVSLAVIAGFILLAGLTVAVGRRSLEGAPPGEPP
jgi:hypothetical protein